MNKVKRMWINQPSTLQQYHHLHGRNVLADFRDDETVIYFMEGAVISQQIDPLALDPGWVGDYQHEEDEA